MDAASRLQVDPERLSEMLVVGFVKHWGMRKVLAMAGWFDDKVPQEVCDQVRAAAPFMPVLPFQYRSPVRAYVSAQWPRLASWLYEREGDGTKVLEAAVKLRTLRSVARTAATKIGAADQMEGQRARKLAKRVYAGNAAMNRQRLSNQRSAWNVCKA